MNHLWDWGVGVDMAHACVAVVQVWHSQTSHMVSAARHNTSNRELCAPRPAHVSARHWQAVAALLPWGPPQAEQWAGAWRRL